MQFNRFIRVLLFELFIHPVTLYCGPPGMCQALCWALGVRQSQKQTCRLLPWNLESPGDDRQEVNEHRRQSRNAAARAAGLELVVSWETGIKCFRKGRPHQVLWEQVLSTL